MVDILTVIPIWVTNGSRRVPLFSETVQDGTAIDIIIYILFGLSTTRILRSLRIHKLFVYIHDPVQQSLGELALTLSVMILFNSALMQYLETEEQPYEYHTWMYYIWVTIATVGYGGKITYFALQFMNLVFDQILLPNQCWEDLRPWQ